MRKSHDPMSSGSCEVSRAADGDIRSLTPQSVDCRKMHGIERGERGKGEKSELYARTHKTVATWHPSEAICQIGSLSLSTMSQSPPAAYFRLPVASSTASISTFPSRIRANSQKDQRISLSSTCGRVLWLVCQFATRVPSVASAASKNLVVILSIDSPSKIPFDAVQGFGAARTWSTLND